MYLCGAGKGKKGFTDKLAETLQGRAEEFNTVNTIYSQGEEGFPPANFGFSGRKGGDGEGKGFP